MLSPFWLPYWFSSFLKVFPFVRPLWLSSSSKVFPFGCPLWLSFWLSSLLAVCFCGFVFLVVHLSWAFRFSCPFRLSFRWSLSAVPIVSWGYPVWLSLLLGHGMSTESSKHPINSPVGSITPSDFGFSGTRPRKARSSTICNWQFWSARSTHWFPASFLTSTKKKDSTSDKPK